MIDPACRFTIRPAQPSDEAGVSAVLAAAYPALLAGHYPAELLAVVLPGMTRAQAKLLTCPTWYVAVAADEERGESILGCGGWTPERPGTGELEPGVGHLRHFGTHPEHLRRGVGRAIVAACLSSARADGLTRLECYSTRAAVSFYAALGLQTLAQLELEMPDPARPGQMLGFPAVHMRLDLD
jgi:GNAT superfamily N-acetyltransferase